MKQTGRFLAILIFSLIMSGCMTIPSVFNAPTVTEESFEVKRIDFDGAEILTRIKVSNSNTVSMDFPETVWNLIIGDIAVASGTIEKGAKIPPMASVVVEIPVSMNFRETYSKFPSLSSLDKAEYRLETVMNFKLPVFGKDEHKITHVGSIPMLRKPEVFLESIMLTGLEPEQVGFSVMAGMENRNGFSLVIESMSYSLKINGDQWSEGTTRRQLILPARTTDQLPINISIKTSEKVSDIYSLILNEADVRYEFTGRLSVKADNGTLGELTLPFKVIGSRRIKL